jgi:UDP:flavonoid glycosyltransferase YjiC (YdhE family)
MRTLIVALGSGGDVDPAIGLGRLLRQEGLDVTVITHGPYQGAVERAGLDFAAVDNEQEYARSLQSPGLVDGEKAMDLLANNITSYLRRVYDLVAERYVPGQTVLVNESSALGGRIAHDRLGLPIASLHISPYAFFHSTEQVARYLDKRFGPEVNGFRAELGLPPVEGIFKSYYHSPQLVIGLFPQWFAPQLDLPANTLLTDFPLFDGKGVEALPPELEEFLQAGPPPLVFTFGTAMQNALSLLEASAAAASLLGRRAILLTRYRDQVPANLPQGVRHFDFIPFSEVLPRSAAVIYHGGIGTASQAMAAGIPQLVIPFAFDQPENARLIKDLGIGDMLSPTDYTAENVAERLRPLLDGPARGKAQEIAQRVRGTSGLKQAADAVIDLVAGVAL